MFDVVHHGCHEHLTVTPGGLALLHAAAASIRSDASADEFERRPIPAPIALVLADWLSEAAAFVASNLNESIDFTHLVDEANTWCSCNLHHVYRPAAAFAAAYLNSYDERESRRVSPQFVDPALAIPFNGPVTAVRREGPVETVPSSSPARALAEDLADWLDRYVVPGDLSRQHRDELGEVMEHHYRVLARSQR